MKFNRLLMLVTILLLPTLLMACGGDDEEESGDSGSDAPELSETFEVTQQGVTLTIQYPSGWVTSESEQQVGLATSQETLDASSGADLPSLDEGEIFVNLLPVPLGMMGNTPSELIESFSSGFGADESITVGEPESATIGGNDAARVSISGENLSGEVLAVMPGDAFMVAIIAASDNYDDADKSLVESMAETITISVEESAE